MERCPANQCLISKASWRREEGHDRCGHFREQEVLRVGSGVESKNALRRWWIKRPNSGRRRSTKRRWKQVEKKAFKVCKWVELRREHWGLRRWGIDVRSSIKLCKDSVINPLKMSDCRWLWENQSGGQAWGKGEGRTQDGWRDAGRGRVEGQTEEESEINWD